MWVGWHGWYNGWRSEKGVVWGNLEVGNDELTTTYSRKINMYYASGFSSSELLLHTGMRKIRGGRERERERA